MDQKIAIPIIFAMLIIAPLAAAEIIQQGNVKYDTGTNDVIFQLKKGWNLAVNTGKKPNYNTCGEAPNSVLKFGWFYNPTIGKWGGINFNTNENHGDAEEVIEQNNIDKLNKYVGIFSVFVYVSKECEVGISRDYIPGGIEGYKLAKGWNFVGIAPEMEGKTWNELFGKCDIASSWWWENRTQQWQKMEMSSNNSPLPTGSAGNVIVIKTTQECSLGEPMPAFPGLPE